MMSDVLRKTFDKMLEARYEALSEEDKEQSYITFFYYYFYFFLLFFFLCDGGWGCCIYGYINYINYILFIYMYIYNIMLLKSIYRIYYMHAYIHGLAYAF